MVRVRRSTRWRVVAVSTAVVWSAVSVAGSSTTSAGSATTVAGSATTAVTAAPAVSPPVVESVPGGLAWSDLGAVSGPVAAGRDGRFVVFSDATGSIRYDVATGVRTSLPAWPVPWVVSGDGRWAFAPADDGIAELHVDTGRIGRGGRDLALAGWRVTAVFPDHAGGVIGIQAVHQASGRHGAFVVDRATGEITSPSAALAPPAARGPSVFDPPAGVEPSLLRLSPGGRYAIVHDAASGALHRFDRLTGDVEPVAAKAVSQLGEMRPDTAVLSTDGRFMVMWTSAAAGSSEWALRRIDLVADTVDTVVTAADAGGISEVPPAVSEDGQVVFVGDAPTASDAWIDAVETPAPQLHLWDGAATSTIVTAADGGFPDAAVESFTMDGYGSTVVMTTTASNIVHGVGGDGPRAFVAAIGEVPVTVGLDVLEVPARLVDTRGSGTVDGIGNGGGRRPPVSTLAIPVLERAGVPGRAATVAVTVTVALPDGPGYLTVYGCGSPRPPTSNLNYTAGLTIANTTIVDVGSGGSICVHTSNETHLIVDVVAAGAAEGALTPIEMPRRLVDTRHNSAQFDAGRGVAGGSTYVLHTHHTGVPASATLIGTVTAVGASTVGFVTVYPCDRHRPVASSLNPRPDTNVANLLLVRPSRQRTVCLYSEHDTDVIVDLIGYSTSADAIDPLAAPVRLVDTRPTAATVDGRQLGGGRRAGGSTLAVDVAGRGGVGADPAAIVATVTVLDADEAGYVTVWACDRPRPTASVSNHTAAVPIAATVLARVGSDGRVCVFTERDVHLIVDVVAEVG